MRLLKKVLLAVTLWTSALAATASPADPKLGVEYTQLPTAQNTEPGKKIEVIEFFAYYCPHCYAFEPALSAWVKKQGDNVAFKRIHVPFNDSVAPQQRLFFTLEALGLSEPYQAKVFQAMHVEHNRLNSDQAVLDFVEKLGIDSKKFLAAYRSFGVDGKIRRAAAMMESYKVEFWPLVVIDGRLVTSPSQADQAAKTAKNEAELGAQAVTVMDFLLAKAQAEKK